MNVGKICRRNVATVRESDELTGAAQLMRERHIGYLVVVDANAPAKPVGVVTDRDMVVTVVARATDARSLRVGDIMTPNPLVVGESEPIEKALQEMRRIGVRRVPIVGTRGELVGVLSLDDILDVLAGELQNVAGSIRNEQRIEGALRP